MKIISLTCNAVVFRLEVRGEFFLARIQSVQDRVGYVDPTASATRTHSVEIRQNISGTAQISVNTRTAPSLAHASVACTVHDDDVVFLGAGGVEILGLAVILQACKTNVTFQLKLRLIHVPYIKRKRNQKMNNKDNQYNIILLI